jgi:hypothetical protein
VAAATLKVSDLLPSVLQVDPVDLRLQRGAAGESAGLGPSLLQFAAAKVQEAIATALQLDVLELIAQAWAKTDELRRLAAESRAPGDMRHLYLAKHEVVSENRLNVVLEFAGMPSLTDHLSLRLVAAFEGVGVTIDGGHIVAVDAGRGQAKVELRYSSAKLLGSTTDWVALPARHTLARPIEIDGSRAAAHPVTVPQRSEAVA